MSEFLPLNTQTGRVRSTSSNVGTEHKPIDFSAVYVIGITGVGAVTDSGATALVNGQSYIDVVFTAAQADTSWKFVECQVANLIDVSPLNVSAGIVTSKTTTGFRLQLLGVPNTANYVLYWSIAGFVPEPVAATTYLLSGPSSGAFGSASTNFTVELLPGQTLAAAMTVTPSDGGAGGTFTPTSVTLSTSNPIKTFTYTAASYGAKTISVTNNKGLTDPANLSFTCVAPTYTLTGPSGGVSGVASTAFTVALSGAAVGTVTVTPSSGGGGGTFTPTTVALTTGSPSNTFTYTPASVGAKTISTTNDGGLTNPANLTYTATAPPFTPTDITGLKLWLKADALALSDGDPVSSWTDSSGLSNHAIQSGGARPTYKTAIVNGKPVVRFDGTDDCLTLTTQVSPPTAFTLFVVHKTTGDACIVGAATANNQIFRIGVAGANQFWYSNGVDINSSTLTLPRSAWNTAIVRSASGTIIWWDSTNFMGSGGSPIGSVGKIGALGTPLALFTNGDVAEVLLYDSAFSNADMNSVQNYLGAKYGITITPILLLRGANT